MSGTKGKSGRKKKLTAAKDLAGTLRHDRLAPEDAGPPLLTNIPYCPSHIQGEARREWRRAARRFIALQVLTHGDIPGLEFHCTLYARWKAAEGYLASEGLTIMGGATGATEVPSPYVKISDDSMREMRAWISELQSRPSSIMSVRPKSKEEELDDYFFNRRN